MSEPSGTNWRRLAKALSLADGRIDERETVIIRRELLADRVIDLNEIEFLLELRKEAKQVHPTFSQFLFQVLKKMILADGVISAKETQWLRRWLVVGNRLDDDARQFLHALKQCVTEVCPEFAALYEESIPGEAPGRDPGETAAEPPPKPGAAQESPGSEVKLPLRPLKSEQLTFRKVAQVRALRDLEAEHPIESLYFSAPHACLCAMHRDTTSAWDKESWRAKPVNWLPTREEARETLRGMIRRLEEDVYFQNVADGKYLQVTGFEGSDVPSGAFGGFGFLVTATQTRKVNALWDCLAREWVFGMTNMRIASTKFAFGNDHVALVEGAKETKVRIARHSHGTPLDLENAPAQIESEEIGNVLFLDQDRYVVCAGYMPADASQWSPQPLKAYSASDGSKLWEGEFAPPQAGDYPRGGSWSFQLRFQPPSGLFCLGVCHDHQKGTAAVVVFDALSGDLLCKPCVPPARVEQRPLLLPELGLACWIRDGSVLELWHLPTGRKRILEEQLPGKPTGAVASPDGNHLAVRLSETTVRVYEVATAGSAAPNPG